MARSGCRVSVWSPEEGLSEVVVVLLDPFREMGAWKNSTETQQSGHAPWSGPEVKNGRSSAEDGTPERLSHLEDCTNVSPSQRGGAVPALLSKRWAEMARQLSRGVRPSGRPPIVLARLSAYSMKRVGPRTNPEGLRV